MSLSLPSYPFGATPVISSTSAESIGRQMRFAGASTPASTAWATINQARYVPFWIPEPIVVVKLLAYNGATAAGNTDIGLYNDAGVEVIAATAALQAGTSSWQEFDVTDTGLAPGLYFIGILSTLTTSTYVAWPALQAGKQAGVYSQAVGGANLPTTATFAALDAAVVPIVGMSTRTLI